MGRILENWRVPIAVLFSAILIIGAYVVARSVESPPVAQASTETALLQAIATKDSDTDGLADWEEALYGTSPTNPDTFKLGMTDGEAVAKGLIIPKAIADISVTTSPSGALDSDGLPSAPADGTITATFAKGFFSLYLAAKQSNSGADLTSDQTNELAVKAMEQLSQNFAPAADYKTATDIKISGSGADALRAFAVAAEAVFKKNTSDATMSEIEYFQSAVEDGDTAALDHLASLAKAYRNSAAGLAALSVPQDLAADDLLIINTVMRLSGIYDDFARVNTDPLAAMLALQQYSETEIAAEQAFTSIAKTYVAAGVVLPTGTPGASFVNVMADIGTRQKAPKTL